MPNRFSQENWQQYSEPKREEPQCRGRRSYRTKATLLAGCNAWIEKQPSLITPLQQEECKCSGPAVDQVSDERGEQRSGRACPPIADSGQDQRQKSQRAHIPPDHTKQKSPGNTEPNAGGLIAE